MSQNICVCDIEPDLTKSLKEFRFSKKKHNHAIIMKVDRESQVIKEDFRLDDCTTETLVEELPTHQPRFMVYSFCFNHSDGRVSYPMVFIFVTPPGVNNDLAVMYAGSKNNLVNATGMSKVLELRDIEDLDDAWLQEQLKLT